MWSVQDLRGVLSLLPLAPIFLQAEGLLQTSRCDALAPDKELAVAQPPLPCLTAPQPFNSNFVVVSHVCRFLHGAGEVLQGPWGP